MNKKILKLHEKLTKKEDYKKEAEDIMKKRKEAGATTTYPWEQCIKDQKKDGKSDESARKICGYIKRKFGPMN